jgi:hypothetical protein
MSSYVAIPVVCIYADVDEDLSFKNGTVVQPPSRIRFRRRRGRRTDVPCMGGYLGMLATHPRPKPHRAQALDQSESITTPPHIRPQLHALHYQA